jgi:NAD(P)H dehydrogenase (quinone)
MSDGQLAVTGATGGLGGRVVRRLADRGVPQRLVVRDPARAPELPGATVVSADYGDGEAMRAALAGVQTLLLVSATETQDRVARHLSAVDAAAAAGVARLVYVSLYGAAPDATFTLARHHWRTEEAIRATGAAYTFLRDSLYQDVLPYFVGADGVIRGPAGDGRCGFVARDDIADVAVTVLLDGEAHNGQTYELTGPETLTFHDVAAELSERSGHPVTYQAETLEEAYASRASYGAPDWMVEGWVTSYAAVATGELDGVSDAVARIAGHPPQSFAEYLRRNPAELNRIRALT